MKTLILVVLKAVIALGLMVITTGFAVWAYPPLALWGLGAVGRSVCDTQEILSGAEKRIALGERAALIREQLRVVEEDPQGYVLWAYAGGQVWVPKGSGGSLAILLAQQEVDEYGNQAQGVQPGDIVLDCGAHVGIYTRKALQGGAKRVIAIEPAPANVECLRRNFPDEIASGQVVVYPKGVWDQEDLLPLYEDPSNSAADRFVAPDETSVSTHTIPLTRIDTLVAELGLPDVDLIKMDIKGATARALHGAQTTLKTHRPRLIISTEEDIDSLEEITAAIQGLNLDYRSECGTCSLRERYTVWPEVVFFRSDAGDL